MKAKQLEKYVGQIVVLDLIMGREITTRVTSVNTEDETITCSKPRVFTPMPPQPGQPGGLQVMAFEYGYPMYKADESLTIDTAHVFTVFVPSDDQKNAYSQKVSGIVQAPANALDGLPTVGPASGLVGM